MRVANTSGLSATVSGTVLPPAIPARISWKVSAAYRREQDSHLSARRFPHRVNVTPSASSAEPYEPTSSPVRVSNVSERPTSRIGLAQKPTRDNTSDQSSNSRENSRATS